MSKKEIMKTKITTNSVILYKPIDESLGRAEFEICPIFKDGFLKEIVFFRKQQRTHEEITLNLGKDSKIITFYIDSWTHKKDSPRIWREYWCKEHETICHNVYVPPKTNKIEFKLNFGDSITIRFVGE